MKLLKLIFCAVMALCAVAVYAETDWGICKGVPSEFGDKNITGARFGLPISAGEGRVEGGEFSLIYSGTRDMEGIKLTLLGATNAERLNGGALALVNLADHLRGAQVGVVNQSNKGGVQVGLVNVCSDDAMFQCGLICVNKNGWLPVMILFNFGSKVFEN